MAGTAGAHSRGRHRVPVIDGRGRALIVAVTSTTRLHHDRYDSVLLETGRKEVLRVDAFISVRPQRDNYTAARRIEAESRLHRGSHSIQSSTDGGL